MVSDGRILTLNPKPSYTVFSCLQAGDPAAAQESDVAADGPEVRHTVLVEYMWETADVPLFEACPDALLGHMKAITVFETCNAEYRME